ncbi:GNAT family N-acetyltransferase [Flexivirga sp. B27]
MTVQLDTVFRDGNGEFALRAVDPELDADILRSWVTHPKATFWMMTNSSVEDVAAEHRRIAADPHHEAFLGFVDGSPAFLMERYDPAHVELVGAYDAEPGDVGMHFLVAPTQAPRHGFTRSVISAVLTALLADASVRRVVVEPDVRNTAVQRINAAVGFVPLREITLPDKTALLSVCTRESFQPATTSRSTT